MDILKSYKQRFTQLLGRGSAKPRETALPVTREIAESRSGSAALFLLHASPWKAGCGGTEVHTLDCLRHLKLPRAVLVYPSAPTVVTASEITGGDVDHPAYYAFRLKRALSWYSLTNSEAESLVVNLAQYFGASAAVIEHLHMWPLTIPAALRRASLPYVCVTHDFFSVCPSLNLVNANTQRPCSVHYGGKDESANCLQNCFSAQRTTPPSDVQDLLKQHQNTFTEILSNAEAVVFPSESARKRVLANLKIDAAKTRVIPHGYAQPQFPPLHKGGKGGVSSSASTSTPPDPPLLRGGELLRVSLCGMLAAPIKGSDLIIELMTSAKALPIEWHFFGVVDANGFRERLQATGARMVIHGPYDRETIAAKLRAAGIDVALFMSIAEETFSYTLSEAWCAGIPALAPRWGALGERVEQSGLGWLVEPHSAPAALAKLQELVSKREEIAALKEKLKSFRHGSLDENAAAYRQILEPLLKKRSAEPTPGALAAAVSPGTAKWQKSFAASDRSVFKLDPRAAGALTVLNHAALSDSAEGIRILSSGHDPSLTLPAMNFGPGMHIARLEISAPGEDEMQLFFQTAREPGFAENRSLKALLYKGRNEIYLLLDAMGLSGQLRLDPGTSAGEFTLHAMEVRGI